jgi:hypothetical protein
MVGTDTREAGRDAATIVASVSGSPVPITPRRCDNDIPSNVIARIRGCHQWQAGTNSYSTRWIDVTGK